MKKVRYSILASLLMAVVLAFTMTSCGDDDDDVVNVNFDESTIEGTWQVLEMDSVQLTTDTNGSMKRTTFQTTNYTNRYIVFSNGTGRYQILDGEGTPTAIEQGTFTLAKSSFRVDLSSGRQLHWLKSEGDNMYMEVYNVNDGTRRARYTLKRRTDITFAFTINN